MLDFILRVMLIGVLATFMMTFFLWSITAKKIINVDMVRAIGSFITRTERNSLLPGVIAHISAGIGFAFCYVFLFSIFPVSINSLFLSSMIGGLVGIVHGVVVSMMLVFAVAEHHPIERYRQAGFAVAVCHLIAHVIYGVSIGLFYLLFI
jgi:hypothetical protein